MGPFGAATRGAMGACQDPYLRFWAKRGFGGPVNLVYSQSLYRAGRYLEAYAHALLGVEGSPLWARGPLALAERRLGPGERRKGEALAQAIWNRRLYP